MKWSGYYYIQVVLQIRAKIYQLHFKIEGEYMLLSKCVLLSKLSSWTMFFYDIICYLCSLSRLIQDNLVKQYE